MFAWLQQLNGKKIKPHSNTRFHYVPGPVFTEPAMAAIYVPETSKPAQRILGGGYPVFMQLRSVQDQSLFARPGVTLDGIGIQAGQYAVAPLTNDDGSWPTSPEVNDYATYPSMD
jgi:hypothetical protein